MNIDVVLRHRSVGLCGNGLWPERDEAGLGDFCLHGGPQWKRGSLRTRQRCSQNMVSTVERL